MRTGRRCPIPMRVLVVLLITAFAAAVGATPIGIPVVKAAGRWTDGHPAGFEIGQPDLLTNAPGLSDRALDHPRQAAVDPTTGKLFVSDRNNHRILRYSSVAGIWTNGQAAEAVLGQSDFISGALNRGGAVAADTLAYPSGLFVDAAGRLWVGDEYNNRVLRFDNAASKPNGAPADGVLGQPDLMHGAPNRGGAIGPATMKAPYGVWVSPSGTLWVTEWGNNRVLRFDNAAAKSDGARADGVLGQPNLTSGAGALARNRMSGPYGLVGTNAGTLFVVELNNSRVLRFDNAASKVNGADADAVLGQADFVTAAAPDPPTRSSLNRPLGVAYEENGGRLFVADTANSRVLIFEDALTLPNGADADNVLGQTDYVSNTINAGGVGSATLNKPALVFFDNVANLLYVGDRDNNRLLRYTPMSATTATSVTSSPNPSPFGVPVTFTAIVTVTAGRGVPTGSVRFKADGNVLVDAAPIVSGVATQTTTSLGLGAHTITAEYTPSPGFGPSNGTLTGEQMVTNMLLMLPMLEK